MRTWVKATIGVGALATVCILALAGIASYFVLGNLERRGAPEATVLSEIEIIRTRFGSRQPLIEIVDARKGDVRINRLAGSGARVTTFHVVSWNADDDELLRTEAPLWLMRFSSINLLSQLGLAPGSLRLTVQDVERYGPGIVVDYAQPGKTRVLVWVD
ncbi:MAG: hypothetical protein H0W18_06970 [Acidobacteria bacterium]|nr:hypothetical protein [Acidobacteriota bacterium]